MFTLTHNSRNSVEIFTFDTEEELEAEFEKIKHKYPNCDWEIHCEDVEELWIEITTIY